MSRKKYAAFTEIKFVDEKCKTNFIVGNAWGSIVMYGKLRKNPIYP